MAQLKEAQAIGEVTLYDAGDKLRVGPVNHYVTDGDVALADLSGQSSQSGAGG
ncbi:hypothetical protein A7A08_02984 [Methyloligella halotolerans]|uniref:Uncharacterized protein n=1 Tax=Methyloligella halotolerans TaxID=1177755 RepID=A0A1E2RV88_9HYPH|nr:hypothetical protein A7A08_02984 [Methyloligella halotolerans]